MIIFSGVLVWIIILDLLNNGRLSLQDAQYTTKTCAFLSMAYFVFFLGLRNAGADTHAYLLGYKKIEPGIQNLLKILTHFTEEESLFDAYGIFMKSIFGDNYVPYLFGIAAVSGFAVAICLYKYSVGFYTSMILFTLWGIWVWMYNGIRQFLAVSLSFLCLTIIDDEKPLRYILCILIISRIHTTALIMIPVLLLVTGEPWRLRTLIIILLAVFGVVFTSPFMEILEVITTGTEYNNTLTTINFLSDTGSHPIRTIVFAIPPLLAFLVRDEIRNRAPIVIKLCVNLSILCVVVSAIANVTSGIYIGRLPIYFSVYDLILLPWIFINTKIREKPGWISLIMILYVMLYIYENYIHGNIYYSSEVLNIYLK